MHIYENKGWPELGYEGYSTCAFAQLYLRRVSC